MATSRASGVLKCIMQPPSPTTTERPTVQIDYIPPPPSAGLGLYLFWVKEQYYIIVETSDRMAGGNVTVKKNAIRILAILIIDIITVFIVAKQRRFYIIFDPGMGP